MSASLCQASSCMLLNPLMRLQVSWQSAEAWQALIYPTLLSLARLELTVLDADPQLPASTLPQVCALSLTVSAVKPGALCLHAQHALAPVTCTASSCALPY